MDSFLRRSDAFWWTPNGRCAGRLSAPPGHHVGQACDASEPITDTTIRPVPLPCGAVQTSSPRAVRDRDDQARSAALRRSPGAVTPQYVDLQTGTRTRTWSHAHDKLHARSPAWHARSPARMANCTPGPPARHARLSRRNLAQSGAIGSHRRSQERSERHAAAAMAMVEKAAVVTCIGECQRGVGGG